VTKYLQEDDPSILIGDWENRKLYPSLTSALNAIREYGVYREGLSTPSASITEPSVIPNGPRTHCDSVGSQYTLTNLKLFDLEGLLRFGAPRSWEARWSVRMRSSNEMRSSRFLSASQLGRSGPWEDRVVYPTLRAAAQAVIGLLSTYLYEDIHFEVVLDGSQQACID